MKKKKYVYTSEEKKAIVQAFITVFFVLVAVVALAMNIFVIIKKGL